MSHNLVLSLSLNLALWQKPSGRLHSPYPIFYKIDNGLFIIDLPDEYEEIKNLRALWTQGIITRDNIFIPLMLGILAVSASQFPVFRSANLALQFLLVEGILLLIAALYWRLIAHRTDDQIVGMYGRMLELEKQNKMETQTRYFYSNLSRKCKTKIREVFCDFPTFENFKEEVKKKNGKDHYDFLYDLWKEHQRKSVGSRGHCIYDAFAIAIVVLFFTGVAYMSTNGLLDMPTQRAATSEEAEQLIAQGWKVVDTLPNGKVILEKQGI